MRTKHLIYAMLIGTALLSSCSDSENVIGGTDPIDPNPGGSSVSTGFDYLTSRNVEFALKSPVSTVVSVYSDAECTADRLLIEDLRISNEAKNLDLNIPIGCTELGVKYLTANGIKTTSYAISSTLTKSDVVFTLPEDAVAPTHEDDGNWTFYHNTGVAMFEDEWPEIARDNDYNDVVTEYDFKVTECNDEVLYEQQGYKEGLLMTLDVRAIGGFYTTQTGVILEGLDKKFVKSINAELYKKAGQGMADEISVNQEMKLNATDYVHYENGKIQYKLTVDTKTDNIIVYFDGLRSITDNTRFYQVEPNNIKIGEPMVRVKIELKGDATYGFSSQERKELLAAFRNMIQNTKNQNFFIRAYTGKTKEVHMRGYEPTYSYKEYCATDAPDWTTLINDKYTGENGFTWGLKLPAGTKHVQEKVDIKDAYPEYAKWVSSNGAENKDWYLHPDDEKVIQAW